MTIAEPKNIPSCYIPGYAKARPHDPVAVDNYMKHTGIGDPDQNLARQVGRLGPRSLGRPLSAAHLGFAISVFSKRLLEYLMLVGAQFTKEEQKSVLAVWRYSGYVMGIPESILYTTAADAERVYKVAYLCEPPPDPDSVTVANMLIQSIPSVANVKDPAEQEKLVRLAYLPFASAHRRQARYGIRLSEEVPLGHRNALPVPDETACATASGGIPKGAGPGLEFQLKFFEPFVQVALDVENPIDAS